MGGEKRENLLIILPLSEDKSITDIIRRKFPNIIVQYHQLKRSDFSFDSGQSLPKDLCQHTAILVTFGPLPSNPEDAPNLKLIHMLSAGVDHIVSHPLFTQTDIPITTSSGIHGPSIAEWVLMSTLVLSKSYKKLYALQQAHKWGRPRQDFPIPSDWVGKKVGIAGYGSIGRQVARVFTSLGCEIYAYTASPRPTPASRADQSYHVPHLGDADGSLPTAWYSGTTKPDLHTFLSQDLDMLVICLPLTPHTHALFGDEEWAILSSCSRRRDQLTPTQRAPVLVNISRGPIVQTPALIRALQPRDSGNGSESSLLSGAALDVTDPEPLPPSSELWAMENVVLTPHVSGLNTRYLERAIGGVLVENLERRERGQRLLNLVERGRGY